MFGYCDVLLFVVLGWLLTFCFVFLVCVLRFQFAGSAAGFVIVCGVLGVWHLLLILVAWTVWVGVILFGVLGLGGLGVV